MLSNAMCFLLQAPLLVIQSRFAQIHNVATPCIFRGTDDLYVYLIHRRSPCEGRPATQHFAKNASDRPHVYAFSVPW